MGAAVISVEEAAALIDEIAATFASTDFSPVEDVIGDDGTWVAISGDEYDRSTVAEFLSRFGAIESVVRTGDTVEGLGGHGFEMDERLSNGTSVTFWLFIARDPGGALVVTERVRPPRS